ncbi:thioredoxin TrxC [Acinetobacter boissieri]|uniref:Thioredoxin n=1 Tax=Acinetobacter boissieri TaxID=1219383 RepID=A0A1G6K7F6_9GAMM|nr:thioredoxin TrxC [Acinetobacter boissieri]SDC26930.1 thioredoxin [Acinetobacter boissieri]
MIIVCPKCMAKNRVDTAQLVKEPLCGRCQNVLIPKNSIELNEQNFSTFIQHSDLPVVIDLWADWCGPCKAMAPHFEHVASQYTNVIFAKINTEENPKLSQAFNIRSIPTLVIMNKTTELTRVSGALKATELKQWIDQNLIKL